MTCYHGPAGLIILTRRAADTRTARTTIATFTQTALPPSLRDAVTFRLAQPAPQPSRTRP